MRWLHVVPTIHSDDEKRLLTYDDDESIEKFHQDNAAAQKHWEIIIHAVLDRFSSFRGIKIFSEGTTKDIIAQFVTDEERKDISHYSRDGGNQNQIYNLIENNLAEMQVLSPQLALLIFLYARGAEIIDCDDTELFKKASNLHREFTKNLFEEDQDKPLEDEEIADLRNIAREFDKIQNERDMKVAESINANLPVGDHGILIFGDDHNVQQHLTRDVRVEDFGSEVRESIVQVRREIGLGALKGMSARFEMQLSEMLEQEGNMSGESKG